jgi:hypothetical protein
MKLAKSAWPLLLIAACGCTVRVVDFTVISTKNQVATAGYAEGPRTKGEDCVTVVFVPFGTPNLKVAIDRAIEAAGPGFDVLVDGVVNSKSAVVFGSNCYEVEGTPINSQAANGHGKKKVSFFDPSRVWRRSSDARL